MTSLAALKRRRDRGAGSTSSSRNPFPPSIRLWTMPGVLITAAHRRALAPILDDRPPNEILPRTIASASSPGSRCAKRGRSRPAGSRAAMPVPVGLNVCPSRGKHLPYLDQTLSLRVPLVSDHVQYGAHKVLEGWTHPRVCRSAAIRQDVHPRGDLQQLPQSRAPRLYTRSPAHALHRAAVRASCRHT